MTLDAATADRLGDELDRALTARAPLPPFAARGHALTVEDAYQIQQRMIARRLARGEVVIGKKIGVTSRAVQEMLDVHTPDFGVLLSGMIARDGAALAMSAMIAPRAEGEIAFVLRDRLAGPGVTPADVLAATELVLPCFEIVDSRIRDWQITIVDTVADNASCGALVLGGPAVDPRGLDLALCGMTLAKNGALVATGAGAAVQGSPAAAVAWLANTLGALGAALEPGELVLSGSLGPLVPVAAGDSLHLQIGGIGGCAVRFVA